MAYATVQSQTAVSTADSTAITATFGATPTEGNLCCAVAMHTGANVLTNVDQNGWGTYTWATGNTCVVYFWSKTAGPSESSVFSMTSAVGVTWAVWLREYSGNEAQAVVDCGTADSTAAAGASSYSITSTLTPSAVTEIAVCAFAQNGSARTATTWSDSFVEAADLQPAGTVLGALGVADKPLTNQTPPTCTVTLSGVTAQIPSMMVVTLVGNPDKPHTRFQQQQAAGRW